MDHLATAGPAGWRLAGACRALRAGGLVAYPTEAVFGLGCDPWNWKAVERLLALKGRSGRKGLILIAADPRQLRPLVRTRGKGWERATATWPGFVTWVLPVRPGAPRWLTGRHRRLAVRVTSHPVAAALCRGFGGPVVSTSANRSGHPPARSASAVRRTFGARVGIIINAALGGEARPSPIRDAATGEWLRR